MGKLHLYSVCSQNEIIEKVFFVFPFAVYFGPFNKNHKGNAGIKRIHPSSLWSQRKKANKEVALVSFLLLS
jgi:hypothetical protein